MEIVGVGGSLEDLESGNQGGLAAARAKARSCEHEASGGSHREFTQLRGIKSRSCEKELAPARHIARNCEQSSCFSVSSRVLAQLRPGRVLGQINL